MTSLKLENQLCHRLYVASNAIIRAYRPILDKMDITYPQYIVLLALWETNAVDIGTLKNKTKIDGGALTLILQKMQKKRLIELIPDKRDRRSKIVSLTERGAGLKQEAQHIPKKLACMLPNIEPDHVDAMKDTLDTLITGFSHNI